MTDRERLEFIKSKWEDADFHNGKYNANHDEVKFLLEQIERFQEACVYWRRIVEKERFNL